MNGHFPKKHNTVNKEIRLAKQAYYQNSFSEYMCDSRKTWQIINELTSQNSGKNLVTSLKLDGVTITNPTVMLNQFNNHFATIGPKLESNIDSSNSDGYQKYLTGTDTVFQLHPTSTNRVLSHLNCLNKSKATGLDKISARLIWECVDLICIPISDIFNQSISQSIFPDDWKCAKVTPVFELFFCKKNTS